MIVTCPSCDTKYEVPKEILIPNGRRLRCVRCKHTWTQRPPENDDETGVELEDVDVPSLEEISESSGSSKKNKIDKEETEEEFDDDEDGYEAEDSDEDSDEDEDEDEDEEDSSPKKKKRSFFKSILKFFFLIIILVVILLGLLLNRGRILEFWPPAKVIFDIPPLQSLYKNPIFKKLYVIPYIDVGNVDSKASGGLFFSKPTPTEQIIDSVSNLVIRGLVQNQSSIRLNVPPVIQVIILDKEQQEIQTNDFPAPQNNLSAGDEFEYEYIINSVPKEINNFLVRFKIDEEIIENENENENVEETESSSSKSTNPGRVINKEKAAKLKKVFE